MKRALIVGHRGYLGSNILNNFHAIETVALTDIDVTSYANIESAILDMDPDFVINCAAKVDEDLAEVDDKYWEELCKVNFQGALNTLRATAKAGAMYVHICTPFEKQLIDDYSVVKAASTFVVDNSKYAANAIKILPGWFFGGINSRQFDDVLIRSLKGTGMQTLGITNNSYCVPVYMPDFCKALEKLLLRHKITPGQTYVISGKKSCSRYEFAQELMRSFLLRSNQKPDVTWYENNQYIEAAERPYDWTVYGHCRAYEEAMDDFLTGQGL